MIPAMLSMASSKSSLAQQLPLVLHQPQLQHLGLDLDVVSIGFRARRPPLASSGLIRIYARENATHRAGGIGRFGGAISWRKR
jgi:hypothetical protein